MDLHEVESQAQLLLANATRFSGPVDLNHLITVASRNDPSWASDPGKVRLNGRAVELLQRLGYLRNELGTNSYIVTPDGRIAVDQGWPERLQVDWISEWIETEELFESMDSKRTASENTIRLLTVENWRQFAHVEILFHPRLTILTGANGAGKTTLLNILGPHFSWPAQLLTRPDPRNPNAIARRIGSLVYTNGVSTPLTQGFGNGVANLPVSLPAMQQVPGIFINSHRSISSYQALNALPARFSEWNTLQQQFAAEIQVRYSGGSSQHSPLYRMKEALVAAAMYAYGNPAVRANESAREVWEGYQEVLTRFLPSSLRFQRLSVEDSDLLLVTENAEFPLEAVSGGISAMLELSWQIFLRQRDQSAFTVCIDEPENHLHPELQRSIIPSLMAGFPNVTFIVSSHSPLVVTSVQDSYVYALSPDPTSGQVHSRRVENSNPSATSDETLTQVLGLDTALPLWAEGQLEALLTQVSESPTAAELRELRLRLTELGLDRQFPAAVRSIEPREAK